MTTAVFVNLDPQAEEGSGAVLQVVARGGRSVAGQPAGSSLVKTAVQDLLIEVGSRSRDAQTRHGRDGDRLRTVRRAGSSVYSLWGSPCALC